MTTREDDLLERIRQRRKLSEDLDLDSLIAERRKAVEGEEVETVTTAEEEGPGIIERISERVRRVLPGGEPEAPERDPGALGEAVSSTVERGQRLAGATGFPMPDAPRRVPRQRRHTAARDATADPPRRATGITEEPDQGPTREELLARSDVTDTGAREAGRRARRLRNPRIEPLPDDVEDAETPEDVAFGLERLLEDETREDLEELKRRGGRGRRRLGETAELRRPTEAGETRFRMEEGVQAQREELEELSRDLDLILPPGSRTAARVARGLERSPLLGQGILRPLRGLVQKHVRDGDMSAEEFLDTVEARGMDVPAEVLGELAGYGLEIGATARGLGAVGEALPSGSRTGRFLRAFNPSRPTTRARAAATGAAEGLPSDVAAAVQHDDPSMIPLGMGLGAAAGAALRPRLRDGRARGADDLVDDVGGAERRGRADEVETVSTPREEKPGIRRRIADAIDPSRQEELEQAFRDPLTELPNQTAFRRARGRLESDPNTELVEIDLTNFKAINDQVSREAGDARLKEVADVARQVADEAGVETRDVFRAGGDEFAIAVPRGQGDEVGRRIAERVEDFEVPGTEFTSRVRYGVGETFEEADAAAQAAKKGEAGARFRDTSAGGARGEEPVPGRKGSMTSRIVHRMREGGEEGGLPDRSVIVRRVGRGDAESFLIEADAGHLPEAQFRSAGADEEEARALAEEVMENFRRGLDARGRPIEAAPGGAAPFRPDTRARAAEALSRAEEGPTLRPDEPRLLRSREAQRSVPEDVDLTPFEGMSREEFLGSPKITSDANAADLRPKLTGSAAEMDPQPWHQGLQIRRPEPSRGYTKYVVTDDGKPVASYDGDTLVVDPEYRDQGIATQLVVDFRTRNPNVPPATTRTAAAQNIQETAWEAIQREVRRRRSGRPDDPRPLTPRDQRPRATETPPPEPSPMSEGFDPTGVRQARRRGQPGPQASAQLRDIGEFSMEPGAGVAPDPTKIARDLAEAVDVKLAEGQLTGRVRSALGIFKPRSEVVRVQDVSDIRTLGHEVGHSLQKIFFGSQGGRLNDAPLRELSEPIQQELRELGSGVSDESLAEGWAEYWRRYVDNPEVLPERAPRLHQYVQRGLDEHPEIRTALEKTRDQWRLHREAGPEARIASKISEGDEPRHFDVSDAWDRFRTNVLDDFHPIKRVVDFLEEKGVGPTSITENAEQLARLVRGSTGQGDHFLEKGTLDFATLETRGKPLKEIVEPVKGRLDRFKRYIVARRAVELHERGINPGFREEDVRAFVRRMDDVHGEDFQQAFAELQTYQTQLLEYLRDAGVISDESLEAILEVNRNYVPFYRALEGKEFLGGLSERFGHLFSPVKRIKGSGEKVIDPLESITKNTYLYTHLAAKQQVSQALGRLAMKEGAGQMLEGIMRPVEPIKFTLDEIRSQLDEMLGGEVVGEIVETMVERGGREDPLEELLMVFRPGDYFDRPNTISVLQGGKRQWFEVDEDLYAALEGLNREHLDWTARFLGAPARTLRAGAVLAPEFQIRNPARDQLMAFVQSEYGYKPGIDMARGMFELLRKGDAYWQWKAAGGERAALLGLDRKAMRDKVEELIQSGGVPNVIKDPLDGLRALSAVMEDATRVGEFLRAREQLGTSKEALQQAAGAAREVSTDFARHGAKLAFVRHTTSFWNARMVGYDRLARAIKENPRQALGRAFVSVTLPSILEYQINRDNPEYWEIPQWQRDLFWLFEVGDTWIRVPKPFELGVIFGTLPQRILQTFDQGAPNELTEFFLQTTTSETEGLAPFPTALQPLVENFANYSVFLERPIVPLSQERLSAERQFGPYTSEAAKMIGRWAPGQGLSPRKLDHLLFSYTGGLGRHAMSAIDRGVAAVRGDPPDPSGTLADVPGLRGVVARDPGFSSTSVEKFYRLYARANRAVADLRDLENRGSRDELREQASDPKKRRLRALAPGLRDVAGELSDLRDERDRIRQDPNMDPDEKRERMDELGRRAMIAARRAIQRLPEGVIR